MRLPEISTEHVIALVIIGAVILDVTLQIVKG